MRKGKDLCRVYGVAAHYGSLHGVCVNDKKPHPIWLWPTTTLNMRTVEPLFLDPNVLQKIRKTDLAFGIVLSLLRSVLELNISFCLFSSSSTLCPALLSSSWLVSHFLSLSVSLLISSLSVFLSDYVRECIVGTGQSYRGRRSVTVSGILCQAWASPIPHEHK